MRFYLTTAIDYVNSRPHLGTAYEKISADVIARYQRLRGRDVRFLMGNDEHSQNVYRKARELGVDPLEYCDQMEVEFRRVWDRLNISFDDFIRTTEPRHKTAVQTLAQRCFDAGDVYEGVYEGWYCVSCEAFKQEKDLVDGACPVHGVPPDWIREKNHFFRLSAYRDALLRHYDQHPEFVQPDIRRNEMLRLLEGGLDDISISRSGQSWGIPVPFDPSSVIYVWFDALINYASAVGYGQESPLYDRWWPADLHIIGKDITRFHAVVWPAMLMSVGAPLPRRVFSHGFITIDGQRMSKSLGNVVDPLDVAERLGVDPMRLFLMKEAPYGSDPDFTWSRLAARYNSDLANNLGNLVSRVTAMAERYRGGRLTPGAAGPGPLAAAAAETVARYVTAMDRYALSDGAAAVYSLLSAANEFITSTAPWALAKEPAQKDRLDQVLFDSAEALRIAATLLQPFMPASAAEISRRVGESTPRDQVTLDPATPWRGAGDRVVRNGPALWPRVGPPAWSATDSSVAPRDAARNVRAPAHEGERMMTEQDQPAPQPSTAAPTSSAAAPPAPAAIDQPVHEAALLWPLDHRIGIDDFMKVDLRTARVVEAERAPKSKKLLKLTIDLGSERRTLMAGIADAYEPADLVGRVIAVVANLKPATLMGVESNGMVLAASPEGGKPMLITLDPATPLGIRIR